MGLEEKTLPTVGSTCEECGAPLTDGEHAVALETGRALCAVHAAESVPVADEDPLVEPVDD